MFYYNPIRTFVLYVYGSEGERYGKGRETESAGCGDFTVRETVWTRDGHEAW